MKLIIIIALSFWGGTLLAQNGPISFENIKKESAHSDSPILLVFSGSDWCKPCIQLKKNIIDSEEFSNYAQNLKFLYLDFPYKKVNKLSEEETIRNEKLADKFNKKGAFPKVVLINAQEEVLGEIVYQKSMTTKDFIQSIDTILN